MATLYICTFKQNKSRYKMILLMIKFFNVYVNCWCVKIFKDQINIVNFILRFFCVLFPDFNPRSVSQQPCLTITYKSDAARYHIISICRIVAVLETRAVSRSYNPDTTDNTTFIPNMYIIHPTQNHVYLFQMRPEVERDSKKGLNKGKYKTT